MGHSALPSLRPVLLAAVSSSLLACGGSTDDGGVPGPAGGGGSGGTSTGGSGGSVQSAPCEVDEHDHVSYVAGLNTEPPSNFVGSLGNTDGAKYLFYAQDGVPCDGAEDPSQCKAELDAILAIGEPYSERPVYVVTNQEGAREYVGPEAILGLLGTIDTPNEAVVAADVYVECSAVSETKAGYSITVSATNCSNFQSEEFQILVASDGTVTSEIPAGYSNLGCAVPGRLTDDLGFAAGCDEADGTCSRLAAYLSDAAQFEAAAIAAFLRIESELHAWGAPEQLIASARRAAADELEHARVMHELARARGARPGPVMRGRHAQRSLLGFAIENATEGCVNELFSAACAHFQAQRATDPELRRAVARIAEDETRHAELSQAIHDWCLSRLSASERAQVESARRHAVETLRVSLDEQYGEGLQLAGLPSAAEARALHDALQPVMAA